MSIALGCLAAIEFSSVDRGKNQPVRRIKGLRLLHRIGGRVLRGAFFAAGVLSGLRRSQEIRMVPRRGGLRRLDRLVADRTVGALGGMAVRQYSPKVIILGGCVICAAAMALLSTTKTLLQWYFFARYWGSVSRRVSGAGLDADRAVVSKQRGLAVGVINAGVGLGGYIFPKLHAPDHAIWLFAGVPVLELIPDDPVCFDPGVGHRRDARGAATPDGPSRISTRSSLWTPCSGSSALACSSRLTA